MPPTRVSAVPDRLDRLVASDLRDRDRALYVSDGLDNLAAALVRGADGRVATPVGGRGLRDAARQLDSNATFVSDVASQFRQADMRAYLDASTAVARTRVPAVLNRPGRIYMRADQRGDGRVVEVLGDLATAHHVVLLVPGMTNQLSNYETQLRPKAVALLNAARAEAPKGEGVAVIAWLGYNTPDGDTTGLVDAAASSAARDGAGQLRTDLDALRLHGLRAHVTVVGHSYGSVVAGRAMRPVNGESLQVDDVVVVGSPGMDARNREGLGSPNVRVWAGRTGDDVLPGWLHGVFGPVGPLIPVLRRADPVPYAPGHGPDPTRAGFGSRNLPVDGHGHSDYFEPGTTAVRSIARVVVGRVP